MAATNSVGREINNKHRERERERVRVRVREREEGEREGGREREGGGDRLLTFIFIRHKVFNLDMDKETGRVEGIVVLVSERHVPEPSPEVVAGQHP